ncbi:MAG: hypothetical protein K6G56_00500 [Clostridiales bacterium]|nr:hypothetical protein [Clostridiales bacterium]
MQRTGTGRPGVTGEGTGGEASPLLRLARRIREEQGAERVREFLAAMMPFAAPGEIRHISEGFGIPFESVENAGRRRNNNRNGQSAEERLSLDDRPQRASQSDQGMNMLRTLMQLKGLMNGAPDPRTLMELMGSMNRKS